MSKFRVGDEVKVIGKSGIYHIFDIGDIVKVVAIGSFLIKCRKLDKIQFLHVDQIEPVTNSKVTKITPYMRKKYMLLKDSFDLKKGAVLEEDGEKYRCITPEKIKYAEYREDYTLFKQILINNPKWFKEVTLIYVAKEQVKKVEKFLKKLI